MTSLADRSIAALRAHHTDLAGLIASLSDEDLTTTSGASEWDVAQVLSHLGSGAEISLATFTDVPAPEGGNEAIWDRWNAMGPREKATGFLEYDEKLVAVLEAVPVEERETREIKMGFLPAPIALATAVGMRLNEVAQHSWDARVTFDPSAGVDADAAAILIEQFATGMGFLLGFTGKADQVSERVVLDVQDSGYAIVIDDKVSVAAAGETTATFLGPVEAAIRLIGGRLTEEYTPDHLDVIGNVTIADLRRVFPGF